MPKRLSCSMTVEAVLNWYDSKFIGETELAKLASRFNLDYTATNEIYQYGVSK